MKMPWEAIPAASFFERTHCTTAVRSHISVINALHGQMMKPKTYTPEAAVATALGIFNTYCRSPLSPDGLQYAMHWFMHVLRAAGRNGAWQQRVEWR